MWGTLYNQVTFDDGPVPGDSGGPIYTKYPDQQAEEYSGTGYGVFWGADDADNPTEYYYSPLDQIELDHGFYLQLYRLVITIPYLFFLFFCFRSFYFSSW